MRHEAARVEGALALLVGLGLLGPGCGEEPSPPPPEARYARGLVASYHAESTRAGLDVLAEGGNAIDAFVAATFVDYVVGPGTTSPAGPLGALVHLADGDRDVYLDGDLNEVLDPEGHWTEAAPTPGKAFAVPGAVAALAELAARHGTLPLPRLLEPAIRTARDGFVPDAFYVGAIQQSEALLKESAYGRDTFFPGGQPIAVGATFRLPELATFLEGIAAEGAAYVYEGDWARAAVEAVGAAGGRLTLEDLARYQPVWREPRRVSYRGFAVVGPGARAYGGLFALVGLKVLEHTRIAELGHYSSNADALELMVRLCRTLHEEPWFFDETTLDDEAVVATRLAEPYTASLWERLRGQLGFTPLAPGGSHSYHIIVVDRAGNLVTGVNTIESMPFAQGIFVQGVPLNGADALTAYQTAPGERLVSPFSVHVALEGGRPIAAAGAFGTSLIEVELEMLVDLLDYRMAGPDVASAPRFGTFPFDWDTWAVDVDRNWLDPRIPQAIVDTLAARGLRFSQDPYGDLGFGSALTFDGDEPVAGAIRTFGLPVSVDTFPPR